MASLNLKDIKSIHFTGIKGVGMTSLALCAKDLGIKISGSDTNELFVTDSTLQKAKIKWQTGFAANHIGKIDLLIYTAAHGGETNIEVKSAKQKHIPVMSQGEAVGLFMKGKTGISVSGVGGKTTTTAMIATILDQAKFSPSFAVGAGNINKGSNPGHYNLSGQYFVTEADEYYNSPQDSTPKFLYQHPQVIVITNIEYDHPDVYKNLDETMSAFKQFISHLPKDGLLIANIDNKNIAHLIHQIKVSLQTYGFSSTADWQIVATQQENKKLEFTVKYHNQLIDGLYLRVPGEFNIKNAVAAMAVANYCGIGIDQIKQGLKNFKGTKRRFEFIKKINDIDLYDDYAHHPSEIKVTLEAAKLWFPKRRIVAIFQPHTYSRTKQLLPDFANSFFSSDLVIILPIYASARESVNLGISSKILVKEVAKNHADVHLAKDRQSLANLIKTNIKPGDVLLTLGAGDIFKWHREIINNLKLINNNEIQ